jgi:hypothetical protein
MTTSPLDAPTTDARTLVDPVATVQEYISRADWRVNANANQDYSVGGLILNASGKMIANYWLDEVFSPQAARAHREGDLHIHDLDMLTGILRGLVAASADRGRASTGSPVRSPRTRPSTSPPPAARS